MKREPSIQLSPKHGLNPVIQRCFFCQQEMNQIALLGKLPNDEKAPISAVLDMSACDRCAELQKQGIICISVDAEKSGPNPSWRDYYRTGGWVAVEDEYIDRLPITEDLKVDVLKKRMMFLDDDSWDMLGLPRSEDTVGYWRADDGSCACESIFTRGMTYVDADGTYRPVECQTTYGEFVQMQDAMRQRHPEVRLRWCMGRCPRGCGD